MDFGVWAKPTLSCLRWKDRVSRGSLKASALSTLNWGFRLPREGEAPAEPLTGIDVSPGSRLSRSFALPDERGPTPHYEC